MKNLANKDEILETARQQASVDQKKEQTTKKQNTSVNVTINQKMGQQSQEKAIAASDQKNQRQEKADKPVLRHRYFEKDEEDEEVERYMLMKSVEKRSGESPCCC